MNKQEKIPTVGYGRHISTGKSLNILLPDPVSLTEEEIGDIKEFLHLIMSKLDRQAEKIKNGDN